MSKRARIIVAVAVAACLVIAGVAWWWRTVDRREEARADTERSRVAAVLAETSHDLAVATDERDTAEVVIERTTQARDTLNQMAADLQSQLDRVRSERDTTALDALATGVRAGAVAQCLQGVQQALNQLSVGDRGGIASLQRVEGPCREASA